MPGSPMQPSPKRRRSRIKNLLALRGEAEISEGVVAVEVEDALGHLAIADMEQIAPFDRICPTSSPLVLPRPLKRRSTRTRSLSSSRYCSASKRKSSQVSRTPRHTSPSRGNPVE